MPFQSLPLERTCLSRCVETLRIHCRPHGLLHLSSLRLASLDSPDTVPPNVILHRGRTSAPVSQSCGRVVTVVEERPRDIRAWCCFALASRSVRLAVAKDVQASVSSSCAVANTAGSSLQLSHSLLDLVLIGCHLHRLVPSDWCYGT